MYIIHQQLPNSVVNGGPCPPCMGNRIRTAGELSCQLKDANPPFFRQIADLKATPLLPNYGPRRICPRIKAVAGGDKAHR
jgi:hypothetical protein